jgi:hypothetical protein
MVRSMGPRIAQGDTRPSAAGALEDVRPHVAPCYLHGAPGSPRLARAVVTGTSGTAVDVALSDGTEARATFALALPYEACVGDVLLVIGDGAEHFVIGVISGKGKTSLELQGDVALHAVGGALALSGDEGVSLRGPVVEVQADRLQTVARAVVETFSQLFQRVSDVLHVHARQHVSITDEGSYAQAKTTAIQTEETVTINGKEIHLG